LQGVDQLTSEATLIALGAGVIAVIALIAVVMTRAELRRLRADQRVLLGEHGRRDMVEHAAGLDRAFGDLKNAIANATLDFEARMTGAENRIDAALTRHGVVHYNAYDDVSGRRSTSIALLDGNGSGVVISALHLRDQARVYAKEVRAGATELPFSPEEEEAMRIALAPAQAAAGRA
jgi:hypothetical protein